MHFLMRRFANEQASCDGGIKLKRTFAVTRIVKPYPPKSMVLLLCVIRVVEI